VVFAASRPELQQRIHRVSRLNKRLGAGNRFFYSILYAFLLLVMRISRRGENKSVQHVCPHVLMISSTILMMWMEHGDLSVLMESKQRVMEIIFLAFVFHGRHLVSFFFFFRLLVCSHSELVVGWR
jgi:hypothetical protein